MLRDRVYLLDMLDAARLAVSYLENVTRDAFYGPDSGRSTS